MKRSFVQINGELYEKTGDNSAIVAGELWFRIAGRWSPAGSISQNAPAVLSDIAPYQSTIDGSLITSRSHHREHLRAHGCIEVGNERPRLTQPTWSATAGLRQELIARINS